jgi:S1-C subfamily serine protease
MTASRISLLAVLAALLGGAVAVGIAAVAGLGGSTTTTVIQQSPLAGSAEPASNRTPITARDIYRRDSPGVVFITANVTQTGSSAFGFPQTDRGVATGSGFVLDKQGTILTNAHVVDGATKVTVRFGDKKTVDAKILGRDRTTDLAVLQVDPKESDLRPLPLGSAKDVQVGDPVVAIGNPFGLDRTLTTGVVSAKQRQIKGLADFSIDNVIQTDAAINPGNSGGPLIDSAGEVIGINSQIETGTGSSGSGNVGIGFAIPIDTAIRLLPDLRKGSVTTGYLGISAFPVDESLTGLNLAVKHGALVQSVVPGGPAAKAGLKGGTIPARVNGQAITIGGDIITKLDGRTITSADDLTAYISSKHKGDTVKVVVVRNGKPKSFDVTLGERPQRSQPAASTQAP